MHEPSATALLQRVDALERQARRSRALSLGLGTLLAVVSLGAWITPPGTADVLRARTLIIEDERGRDRVVIGAPMPSGMGTTRISPSTGIMINDTAGHERFALGLQETGQMSMGFDAAPGNGDPRNPERLNLGVDVNGNGFVRYLDKGTGLAGYLGLRPDNRVWLEFLQVSADSVIRRRVGLQGDQMVREAR
ncbi:hypothetical protein [Longimicrobium sp.]|uniref:hypothetical protein n=1 Tax=Longimicrobium sp. TaxID=2029185 RepID=UPI003B3A2CD6